MEMWLEKKQCTGCGACANACPKNAIKMVEDENGFKYPVIDKSICVNCGLCKRTCPITNKNERNVKLQKVYAAWSNDSDIRYNSTSGGLFSEIAKYVIEIKKGFVVGAKYNENNMVEHTIINNLEGLDKIRQSKYLQSDTNDIFKETKKLLDSNEYVAFCGSPCQIAGLYNFLRKDYQNLLTIEFICRGMNSPKAYKSWLSEIENIENKKVVKVWFKYKENGWKTSPLRTRLDFEDNSYKIYEGEDNKYMNGYLSSNLYIRSSCGSCKFNGEIRQADITLADFWGIEKELDDDKGTSLVIVNNDRGDEIFNNIKNNIFYKEKNMSDIYDGNVCFTTSVEINPNSYKFLSQLNDNNFSKLLKKYSKISFIKKVIRKIKRIVINKKKK